MTASMDYLNEAQGILERIRATQMDAVARAAEICTASIAGGGLVHLFGSGHSRMFVEEMFPRHGSFPGFHPIVELSLTYHNPVVGSNGQRQAMHEDGWDEHLLHPIHDVKQQRDPQQADDGMDIKLGNQDDH